MDHTPAVVVADAHGVVPLEAFLAKTRVVFVVGAIGTWISGAVVAASQQNTVPSVRCIAYTTLVVQGEPNTVGNTVAGQSSAVAVEPGTVTRAVTRRWISL